MKKAEGDRAVMLSFLITKYKATILSFLAYLSPIVATGGVSLMGTEACPLLRIGKRAM